MGVLIAVEGATDEPFAEAVARAAGLEVDNTVALYGHGNLDAKIPRWCQPSNRRPIFVLRDLDPSLGNTCGGALRAALQGPGPHSECTILRIAVREVEAWLLADRQAVAEYFRVRPALVPAHPDDLLDPKQRLVDLCRSSTSSTVRRGMVPGAKSGRKVGPEYTGRLIEFGRDHWRVEAAASASPSLRRAVNDLAGLAMQNSNG